MHIELGALRGPATVIRFLLTLLLAIVVGTLSARPAEAQNLDVKTLLADSISEATDSKYKEVAQAIARFTNNDVDGAHALLKTAKKKYPKLPPAEVLIAKMYFSNRNAQTGHAWLERTVKDNPNDPEAYLNLGQIALSAGRVTEASALFEVGLKRTADFKENPKRLRNFNIAGNRGLAVVAAQREDWATAERHIREMLKVDDDSATAYAQLGVALFQQKKDRAAYDAFKSAREKNKDTLAPEIQMGLMYERRGRTADREYNRTKAEQFMAAAAKRYPDDLQTQLSVAEWAAKTGRHDTPLAQATAEAAVRIDPTSLPAKVMRGLVARLSGDDKTAEKFFELAHLQSPSNFDASNQLALLLAETEETGEKGEARKRRALEFARMNYAVYPITGNARNRFDAATTYGWVLQRLGNSSQARQVFNQVIQQARNSRLALGPDAQYYLATILDEDNKLAEVRKLLEAALESEQPFIHRSDAVNLMEKVKNAGG